MSQIRALCRGTMSSSWPARRTTSFTKGPLFDLFFEGCFGAPDLLFCLRLATLLLMKLYAIRKRGPWTFNYLDATPVPVEDVNDDGAGGIEFQRKH